ncbi:MAG TPA: cohesin domain-containing protein [Candidatus Acidoferrales bacterium]|nr:cohesin domain-containing protein [Candidatus Acidoferrales bacterium]
MRRITCAFALAFAAIVLAGCPKNSNQDFEAGRKAEAIDDYDTALVHYDRALRDQPTNAEYKLRALHMRMVDAQYHVEQGEKAFQGGDLQTALSEFQRAQNVDPSNEAASQGMKKTVAAITAKNSPPSAAKENTDQEGFLEAPPELKPLSRAPISIKATEDSRMIYQTIASLAGLTVEFDPTLTSRRISVDLAGVTLEQALDAVDMESGDFWQPLTGTVIFVAPDNPQKRRDLEPEVVKTFYLANTDTAQDLTEIVTSLRQLLDLRRVQPIASQNAIVIRDTPDKIALAGKIIDDADKAKPEVLIHVQVLTANRDRLRDLGILGGQSATLTFNPRCQLQSPNNSSNCTSASSGSGSGSGTNGSAANAAGIALNQLKNLSTGDYELSLPGATVNAVLTDNQTRIIQDPEMRITDGTKATLTVGEKIPVATGSFQAGVGVSTTSVSPLVNTQFTYQDVGVKIVVTPRIHPDGSITLAQTIDISSLAGSQNIGGINQPIIANNEVDHTVRLQDGYSSVLGGLITRTETKNLNGYPGVSQLPLLKYMFADNSNQVQDNEVLIVLTPHIVRFPSITNANLETIASGTDTNARVYRSDEDPLPSTTNVNASNQQPAAVGPPQAAVPGPAQPNTPGAPTPGAAAQLHFDPANTTMKVGDSTVIGVAVSGVNDLYSIPLMIHYNPAVLSVQEVRDGGFLSQPDVILQHVDEKQGEVVINAARGKTPGVNGAGTLIGLVVRAIAPGTSSLQVLQVNAKNSQQQSIPVAPFEATIQVQQ